MPKATKDQEVIIRGGRVVDEHGVRRADIAIAGGKIVNVADSIEPSTKSVVLDASGCLVTPGLVDLHTHLREPGGEASETIESGSRAAALGGFTAVLAMPNTNPPIDSASVVRDILSLAERALCEVAVSGAITVGRKGERLAPMAEMAALGVRIFTDDGTGVQDAGLMRRALEYGRDLGVTLAQHCEDAELAHGGHMHEGAWSSRLGIPGQPSLAEEAMVARDLGLVRYLGARMHFLHLSTRGSAELVARAKAEGLPVTAEVTPHHLCLTDAEVASFDPVYKVNPPLRTDEDVAALRLACLDGVFDAIATDHAPHADEAKEEPFEDAPPGMIGLETALAACFGALCGDGSGKSATSMDLVEFFKLFCWGPAAIAGLGERSGQGGPIGVGGAAHLCVFDPGEVWSAAASGASRSHNSPFVGRKMQGKVRHTIFHGEPVVIDAVATR